MTESFESNDGARNHPTRKPRPRRQATMTDVAQDAGVSLQTVSRALNNAEKVSKATRDRVLMAMARVGYRPNFAGKSLRRGIYHTVGVCLPDDKAGNFLMLEGITAAACANGYAVTLIRLDASLKEMSDQLVALPIDGLIIPIDSRPRDFDTFIPFPGVNTVLLSGYEHPLCTTIDTDHRQLVNTAIGYLVERGHRHIRYIGGPTTSTRDRLRVESWRATLHERGLEVREDLHGEWSADAGYEEASRLAADHDMTAIFAANDQLAFGASCALQDAGIRVPEDVSIIGVDDSLQEFAPHNTITTLKHDTEQIGRLLFAYATDDALARKGPEAIRVPGTLIERSSVADLR